MLSQKIHIIPEVQSFSPSSVRPIAFWKRIKQNQEKELHLFLLFEGRTEKETHELSKDFWEVINACTNELVLNKNLLSSPEYICEAILKVGNEFLTTWSRKNQIDNWSDLDLLIAVASPQALYFTRIGKSRLLLFRDNQIILADENLSHPRSPQFSTPFSELAGGPLKIGDRMLLVSGEITESFSWEEISSLATPPETVQAFYNVVRSIEVLTPPKNTAFILGDVVPEHKQDDHIYSLFREKLKEAQIGALNFLEFNPSFSSQPVRTSSSMVPWKEILKAFWVKIFGATTSIFKIIAFAFRPVTKKISSLSKTRKIILASFVVLFVAFLTLAIRSATNNHPAPPPAQLDYKAMYDQALQLKDDSDSALIYQDEEKARKSLAEADSLLEQVSQSSEWGIKAIKLRQELSDKLATLDKAQTTETKEIWTVPDNQGAIEGIAFEKNYNLLALTDKGIWEINPDKDNSQAEKLPKDLNLGSSKYSLVPTDNGILLISIQDKSMFVVNPQNKEISEKKDLSQEIKPSFNAVSSFGSSVYLFNPEESQIKQFAYDSNGLIFKGNWLKQDLKIDLQDDPIVSMSIDGNIFSVTEKGNIHRLSGGKKLGWNAEKPGSIPQGNNLVLYTKPEDKNLYLLDPDKKRVVIFEKETGKLVGQVQNSSIAQAVSFQVDEKNKMVYFATPNKLFKLTFTP